MLCPKCKCELSEKIIYCPRCGFVIQIVPDYNPMEDEIDINLWETSEKETEPDNERGSEKKPEKKKGSRKKLYLLLSCILLVLLIGIGIGVFSYVKKRENYNSYDYQMEKAMEYFKTEELEPSFLAVERALELKPGNYEAMMLKAKIFIGQKDTELGESLLKEIVKKFSDKKEAYKMLITIYEEQEAYTELSQLGESINNPEIKKLFKDYLVSPPKFNYPDSIFEESVEIRLSAEPGEEIFYTTDDTAPTEKSMEYELPIELEEGETIIRALSVNEKGIVSEEEKRAYMVRIPAPKIFDIRPESGIYREASSILVDFPPDCKAYYTLDGTIPTTESAEYTGPVEMPLGNQIFSIIAVNESGKASPVERRNYELNLE